MNISELFAERIGGRNYGKSNEIYKFEKIKRAKASARKIHPDIPLLDFGVGEPDLMAPSPIREKMKEAIDDPNNRGYADNGIEEFKIAAKEYLKIFFNVTDIDCREEINHCIGAKSALAMIPLCFINPGDIAITTVPGYPVMATHVKYLGGSVYNVPLLPENNFLPDLDSIPADIARKAKLFYVNYPNNPTGAAADHDFFDHLIEFAEKYNILIIHDAAYATLVYNRIPLSILSRPKGKEVALEIHSMSKSFCMTGWRLGFVAGNRMIVKAFADVKDNIDSGQFKAIQVAASYGIKQPELAENIRKYYERRLQMLVDALNHVGFDAKMPGGTFYLYVRAPKKAKDIEFKKAEDVSEYLIKEHLISTVPWDDAGSYLRFSVTFENSGMSDEEIMDELVKRLKKAELKW